MSDNPCPHKNCDSLKFTGLRHCLDCGAICGVDGRWRQVIHDKDGVRVVVVDGRD